MNFYIQIISLFIILLAIINVYFKIARKYNIVDKPNIRSSHNNNTIRGAGIIFISAIMISCITNVKQYPFFLIGLLSISLVSFIDDISPLSNKVRILVHIFAFTLLFYQIHLFNLFPFYLIILFYILSIGIVNAYNFMDGINGINGLYSLSILLPLSFLNIHYTFIDSNILYALIIAIIVFGIYNFRSRAKCFGGDIGSISIAFVIIYAIFLISIKKSNPIFIMFLCVYGIDSILTLINRLYKKENIFQAHRSHLYQILANEKKISHLKISVIYFLIQVSINFIIISIIDYNISTQIILSLSIILILMVVYILIKIKAKQPL